MKTCPVCDTPYPDQHTCCPTDGAVLIELQEYEPGHVVHGKYSIVRKLGQGGMGVVYLAEHRMLHGQVALKFLATELSRNPQFVKRFRNEAQVAYQLRHPNIVDVTDLDQEEDGRLFIAMEYVSGPSLHSVLCEAQGALPVERALHIARGVAAGLAAAHARGVIHRDIKPENILLATPPGGGEQAKVLDFGIAAMTEGVTSLSRTQGLLLTPDYAAPEQWRGTPASELDGRTDLYALGGVLYEMLTGRTPFHAENMEGWMFEHLQGEAVPLAKLRPDLTMEYSGLDAIVMRLLGREREQRFPSAIALLDALAFTAPASRAATVIQSAPTLPLPVAKAQTESHPETIKPFITLPQTRARSMRWAAWAALAIVAGFGIWFAAGRLRSLPVTAVPVLNPGGGTYAAVQPVTISDATPGASIHYTVNGSAPTTDSPVYTAPIASLPSGTMVRAMAAADGHTPSTDIAGVYNWSAGDRAPAKSTSGLSIPSIPQTVIDSATHRQTVVPPVTIQSKDLTAEQLRAKAYVMMGQEKMNAKDYVSAENNFKMAVNLDPDNAAAERGLAAAKKALGN